MIPLPELAQHWVRYKAVVENENAEIEKKNEKLWADYRKESEEYTSTMKALNERIEAANKRNREAHQKAWDDYKALPAIKRAFADYPSSIGPLSIPTHSTIYWGFPMSEPLKRLSNDNFMVWLMEDLSNE